MKNRRILYGSIVIAILTIVTGVFYYRGFPAPSGQASQVVYGGYKAVSSKPSGWFRTGQDADIVLSAIDFNNTGGALLFNHPGIVASDGTHLLLADRNNNRVLIWSTLPIGNTPPDVVLGQKNFFANNPGTGLDGMNWPVSVAARGGKVVVTDTYNDRILIWNTFPTRNGQPADLVIVRGSGVGLDVEPKRSIFWPWGVWTDGEKLVVTSTMSGMVLIWNSFPTRANQTADLVLTGGGQIGTPRTITSDGRHLIVGDHNARRTASEQGNFVWKSFPTRDEEPFDFFMSDPLDPRGAWLQGDFTRDGKLVMLGVSLHVWNSFPQSESDKPSLTVGPGASGSDEGYRFYGGDGSGLAIVGDRVYISLSNGNKIVGFNSLPTSSLKKPDFAIGSPDPSINTLETSFIISNPLPATDGKSLIVSSDFDRKLYVWRQLPDESGAHPDAVVSLPFEPSDNGIFGNTLVLAGRKTVYVWKALPLNGEKPDMIFQDSIGDVAFKNLGGVAMDNKYFYLADGEANKIYVWEGIPSQNANPKFTLSADQPTRLSSDGKYLVDAATLSRINGPVRIYRVDTLSSNSQPVSVVCRFNLPQGALVYQGRLFVADTCFNRVLVWTNIEDAIAGKNADVILGAETLEDTSPEIGRNKLFWPAGIAFDGSFLWVGEFKFSERVLRFSVR